MSAEPNRVASTPEKLPSIAEELLDPLMGNETLDDLDYREQLMFRIEKVVLELRSQCRLLNTITSLRPERAAMALFRWSIGWTQSRLRREMKLEPAALRHLLVDYSDHLGKWKELGGKIAARSYVRISGLEDELLEQLEDHLESGDYKPDFQDLKNLSIAKAASGREAMLSRGEATSINEERKVVTQADYEDTMAAAQKRLSEMKEAIEV